jgi:ribosomal-protein-alanine N-acetyltransferase
MAREDLGDVTEIDREAFPTQWPPADYGYEFKNKIAHYLVLCDSRVRAGQCNEKTKRGIMAGIRRLFGGARPNNGSTRDFIAGFVGFWIMAGEAHITGIAVRKELRRRGLGEMLLAATFDAARELDADLLTLEVRASNTSAQNLYRKYGFRRVGERKAYYLDRGPEGESREDAFIMTTDSLRSDAVMGLLKRLREELVVHE